MAESPPTGGGEAAEEKEWDIFRLLPPKADNNGGGFWHRICLQILKISAFFLLFATTLGSAVIAKSCFLLITSGIGYADRNVSICSDKVPEAAHNHIYVSPRLATKWVWAALIVLCAPEVICFLRCFHRTMFRNVRRPSILQFSVAVTPSIRPFWFSLCLALLFVSSSWWPNFVSTKSFLPPLRGIADFASRLPESRSKTYVLISLWKCFIYIFCLFYFLSARYPLKDLLQSDPFGEKLVTITATEMNHSQIEQFLSRMKEYENPEIPQKEKTERLPPEEMDVEEEISSNNKTKRKRRQTDEEESVSAYNIYDDYVELNQFTTPFDALYVALFQIVSVILCYHSSKFACKVLMQRMGFAAPILLAVPTTVFVLSNFCSLRISDQCFGNSFLSKELFWECSSGEKLFSKGFWWNPQSWIWLGWFLSQCWICLHLFTPQQERLARSEKLFIFTYCNSFFVDQCLAFNRRRDDKEKILSENLDLEVEEESQQTYETIGLEGKSPPSICSASSSRPPDSGLIREAAGPADGITKIYACATLWHESALEMHFMLKSIFRMDEDQSARRNAQRYLKVVDPDYYEFESHILIDDAFDLNSYGEPIMNGFVRQFLEAVDGAASSVHKTQMKLRSPRKCSTPYGGRFSYLLPGRNRMIVHLKDKNKIRTRKRWSQVMYLYYLLGFQLMAKVGERQRKEMIAENTFILTLDGDVDFTPNCVRLLVDLMKKNRRLGAACGRIHPRGSGWLLFLEIILGPMIWYQKFEYAVGHWLQKATEHMIGCVLCSPGCFSLFRANALMDDDVTRKYAMKAEEAVQYIQYDQGEDRWLCTLLLQRGYRVEYCAASDALTYAPESFSEFFNQRRRWIPSTIANIIDLLSDYRNVVAVNESISIWYIFYQLVMLISSILGPGTIFLMIVGAISISFEIDTRLSLAIVLIPVVIFCVVCLVGKPDQQILFAEVISALFAMLMTAVIVGTLLQIQKDGIMSPHSIFLLTVGMSFGVSAILHPLEFSCILPFPLYFLGIPCMYMLLPIYSICNLNTVSWGTREGPTQRSEEKQSKGIRFDLTESGVGARADGSVSVGCGNVCRLMCCLTPDPVDSSPQIWKINETLKDISHKLESDRSVPTMPNEIEEEDEQSELNDNSHLKRQSEEAMKKRKRAANETWLFDKSLKRAEKETMEEDEERFWTEMIEKYLQPVAVDSKTQQTIKIALTELRNKMCAAFFMINIVFIIVVLVLQMQKDCLHIEWPLGPKFNHTVMICNAEKRERVWVVSRLQLEPIGLLFLVFYITILVIQFVAMLLHRFGTLEHIIASTDLFCFKKGVDKLAEDKLAVENAVEIARELQQIRSLEEEDDETLEEKAISRRRVVRALELSRRSTIQRQTETLDAAFRRRYFERFNEDSNDNMGTTRTLEDRHKRFTLRNGNRALRQNSLFGTIDRRIRPSPL